jgi:hypothetical protein
MATPTTAVLAKLMGAIITYYYNLSNAAAGRPDAQNSIESNVLWKAVRINLHIFLERKPNLWSSVGPANDKRPIYRFLSLSSGEPEASNFYGRTSWRLYGRRLYKVIVGYWISARELCERETCYVLHYFVLSPPKSDPPSRFQQRTRRFMIWA